MSTLIRIPIITNTTTCSKLFALSTSTPSHLSPRTVIQSPRVLALIPHALIGAAGVIAEDAGKKPVSWHQTREGQVAIRCRSWFVPRDLRETQSPPQSDRADIRSLDAGFRKPPLLTSLQTQGERYNSGKPAWSSTLGVSENTISLTCGAVGSCPMGTAGRSKPPAKSTVPRGPAADATGPLGKASAQPLETRSSICEGLRRRLNPQNARTPHTAMARVRFLRLWDKRPHACDGTHCNIRSSASRPEPVWQRPATTQDPL
ncbi:hypothetical protein VTI74DRAFT_11421 [Chaetomium olivicolor]